MESAATIAATAQFHDACRAGDMNAVLSLFKNDGEAHLKKSVEGKDALAVATEAGKTDVVELLKKLKDVGSLSDQLTTLQKKVNDERAASLKMKSEAQAKLEQLETERLAETQKLMDEIDRVKAQSEALKTVVRDESNRLISETQAALEKSEVMLSVTRNVDKCFIDRLSSNLVNLSCEEVHVLMTRAGVRTELATLKAEDMTGDVLQANYTDVDMLNKIGITKLGQIMRCQQLVEHLVAGRPFASLPHVALPDSEECDGSFETWSVGRVANFILEADEKDDANNNTTKAATAAYFTLQMIAGDVLDRADFSEQMKEQMRKDKTAGVAVPAVGAYHKAQVKLQKLVAENPRTGFLSRSQADVKAALADVKAALAKDEQFSMAKLEICNQYSTLSSAVPACLKCPLTDTLIYNAVTTDDGVLYDHFAITRVFEMQRAARPEGLLPSRTRFISPVTGAVITSRLQTNTAINSSIGALITDCDSYTKTA